MFRTAALLVSVFVSTTVGASEWWLIAESSDENPGFFCFVDKESFADSGTGRIKFWDWIIQNKDVQSSWGAYRTVKMLSIEDCHSKKSGVASAIYYDSNGKIVHLVDFDNPELSEIVPDSIGEFEHKFVCSRGKSRKPGQTWAIDPEAYAERLTP